MATTQTADALFPPLHLIVQTLTNGLDVLKARNIAVDPFIQATIGLLGEIHRENGPDPTTLPNDFGLPDATWTSLATTPISTIERYFHVLEPLLPRDKIGQGLTFEELRVGTDMGIIPMAILCKHSLPLFSKKDRDHFTDSFRFMLQVLHTEICHHGYRGRHVGEAGQAGLRYLALAIPDAEGKRLAADMLEMMGL